MDTPVLIVGAGPVGLTMACELARYGVPLRIVDKAAQRTDKSKAIVVWSRTLELLDRADLAAPFVAAGLKLIGANIFAGERPLAHVGFESIQSAFPFGLSLPQSETERLLEERLNKLGVAVERRTELVNFSQSEDKATCILRTADGGEQTVDANWLIGCDGAHSLVRHHLGLEFRGDTMSTDFALADVHVSGLSTPPNELASHMHHEGIVMFIPIGGTRWRIIAELGRSPDGSRPDPTFEEVQALTAHRVPGVKLSDPIWVSGFTVNERMVDSYRVARAFVAGDAAHVHSPAGGQGMNTGMQDAFNLAWKLALVVKGLADPEALLDSYSPERASVARQVLADSGRLTEMATLSNPIAEHLRNFLARHLLGLESVRHALATKLSETSVGYPDSPLNHGSISGFSGPAPGQRFADGAPFGRGDQPRFALVAAPSPEASHLIAEFRRLLESDLRTPPDPGGVWLVRPDGYVAIATRADDWDTISSYLRRIGR